MVNETSTETRFGLIGYPLGHSFSAAFFNDKFKREGIRAIYSLFPIPSVGMLPGVLATPGLRGLNVTIPYKDAVIPFLTHLDSNAAAIGAVNVIKISDDGKKLIGFNTDAIGFRNSISPLLRPHMKRALVLGTGGASKAVAHVLSELGLTVTMVSRKKGVDSLTYAQLTPEVMARNHVVVNTTPLGMWPHVEDAPQIPYESLTPAHLCFDLVYNPEVTEFMKRSAVNGAQVKNGLEMLHGQALAAWEIWNS